MLHDPNRPGEWASVYCTNEYSAYICQMPADIKWDPNDPPVSRCSNDYQSYFLSCYKFVPDVANYATAKTACENEGAVLASFPDRFELAFGETVMHYRKTDPIWIGLERDMVNI